MQGNEILLKLSEIFKDIFDDECEIDENTTRDDVDNWDSLSQISLVAAVEDEFSIKIPNSKITSLKSVRDLIQIIEENL